MRQLVTACLVMALTLIIGGCVNIDVDHDDSQRPLQIPTAELAHTEAN